jgi:hypothetical protein
LAGQIKLLIAGHRVMPRLIGQRRLSVHALGRLEGERPKEPQRQY